MPGNQGRKRTQEEREADMIVVAKMWRRGYTQEEIALKLQVTQPQVSYDLKLLRQKWHCDVMRERQVLVREKIEEYREIRREAWEAWERSKDPIVKRVTEWAPPYKKVGAPGPGTTEEPQDPPGGKGKKGKRGRKGDESSRLDPGPAEETIRRIKVIVTREGRLPANEYLTTMLRTLEMECKILGLTTEEEGDKKLTFPWDRLFGKPEDPDLIEGQIHNAGLPVPKQVELVDPDPPSSNGSNGNTNHEEEP